MAKAKLTPSRVKRMEERVARAWQNLHLVRSEWTYLLREYEALPPEQRAKLREKCGDVFGRTSFEDLGA
jgi:hypothetical protein